MIDIERHTPRNVSPCTQCSTWHLMVHGPRPLSECSRSCARFAIRETGRTPNRAALLSFL